MYIIEHETKQKHSLNDLLLYIFVNKSKGKLFIKFKSLA